MKNEFGNSHRTETETRSIMTQGKVDPVQVDYIGWCIKDGCGWYERALNSNDIETRARQHRQFPHLNPSANRNIS